MPRHVHIRDISNNFYGATKDLSEPVVVTKHGQPVMTITGTNLNPIGSIASLSLSSGGGGGGSHNCRDYCVQCNRSQALDYLKDRG